MGDCLITRYKDPGLVLRKLEVVTMPTTTSYTTYVKNERYYANIRHSIFDTFDSTGLTLRATFSDYSTKDLIPTSTGISFDSEIHPGDSSIRVYYTDSEASGTASCDVAITNTVEMKAWVNDWYRPSPEAASYTWSGWAIYGVTTLNKYFCNDADHALEFGTDASYCTAWQDTEVTDGYININVSSGTDFGYKVTIIGTDGNDVVGSGVYAVVADTTDNKSTKIRHPNGIYNANGTGINGIKFDITRLDSGTYQTTFQRTYVYGQCDAAQFKAVFGRG